MPATTLSVIEALPQEILMPKDVAAFLHSTENTINCEAKAGRLVWAYKLGKRTVIPKEAFVNYHKYGKVTIEQTVKAF